MIDKIELAGVTNLCEDGRDTRYIQKFLGHSSIKTTTIYTHLTKSAVDKIKSPLVIMEDENNKRKLEWKMWNLKKVV